MSINELFVEMISAERHSYAPETDILFEHGFELAVKSIKQNKPVYMVYNDDVALYMLGDLSSIEKKLRAALKKTQSEVEKQNDD